MLSLMSILAILIFLISSCGSPKTSIRVTNKADGTDTRITVNQGDGGSTTVSVVPTVSASLDSIQFQINKDR